jgi:hypothetical protein
MRSTVIGLMTFILVIQLVTSLICGHFGIGTDQPYGTVVAPDGNSAPSAWDAVSWIWNSIQFAFKMMAFAIPGCPAVISLVWNIMTLIMILCIAFLARGGGN